jgi:hypothetical protein
VNTLECCFAGAREERPLIRALLVPAHPQAYDGGQVLRRELKWLIKPSPSLPTESQLMNTSRMVTV